MDFINNSMLLAGVEIGKHYYWKIGEFEIHGQVFIVSWFVISLLFLFSFLGANNPKRIPSSWQNFMELLVEYTKEIAVNQIGKKHYQPWLPFISTLFLFILGSNCAGTLIPWKLFILPEGELASPSNDINTTVAFALLTSGAYFFAGFQKKGLGYFKRYVMPTPILLPINILEDFTKPLSLSFRLFGNILADELTVSVLVLLVPLIIPLPIMALGLFAGSVQALIFSTLAGAYIHEALE